jgi:hypothetical protein
MSATASVGSDGDTVTIDPAPPKLVTAVLRAATVTPLPDSSDDRLGYAKALRDILLAETDWTQASDAPLSQVQREAWAAWREAVRGVPDADDGSGTIAWPSPPVVTASAVPSTVTRWRMRKALLVLYSITPANVESFIVANTTEGTERELALIDWRDSPTVRRDHPLITPFVAYLSAAREETIDADEFFRYAAALE